MIAQRLLGDCCVPCRRSPSWEAKLARTSTHTSEVPPGGPMPLQLVVSLQSTTVMIDRDTGVTYARIPMQLEMRWRDARLLDRATNPALDVWARYLSLDTLQATLPAARATVQERMTRFLLPELGVSDEHSSSVR